MAEIWRDVLEVGDVGRRDDFFDLGGHSILAIRLISRIRSEWDIDVELEIVFRHPTIAALADRIEEATERHDTGRELEPGLKESRGIELDSPEPGGGNR